MLITGFDNIILQLSEKKRFAVHLRLFAVSLRKWDWIVISLYRWDFVRKFP